MSSDEKSPTAAELMRARFATAALGIVFLPLLVALGAEAQRTSLRPASVQTTSAEGAGSGVTR
jgi:hypothetical protein